MTITFLNFSLTAYKWFWCIMLVVVAIYSTIDYFKNTGKVSSVDYSIFHESPKDKYPAFSICVEMMNPLSDTANKENILILNNSPVQRLASVYNNGEIVHSWSKNGDIWLKVEVETKEDTKTTDQKNVTEHYQFYGNPNLPNRSCITRNNSQDETERLVKNYDSVVLNKTMLTQSQARMKIYIHHPGQLMRKHHKHDYVSTLKESSKPTFPSELTFQIVYVSVSRLREDAPISCSDDISDEDKMRRFYIKGNFWERIIYRGRTLALFYAHLI